QLDQMEIEIEASEIVEIDGIVGVGLDRGLEMKERRAAPLEQKIGHPEDIVHVMPFGMDLEECQAHLFGLGALALLDERADLSDLRRDRIECRGKCSERFHEPPLNMLPRRGI